MKLATCSAVLTMVFAGCTASPHDGGGDDVLGGVAGAPGPATTGGSNSTGDACAVAGPPGTVEAQLTLAPSVSPSVLVANAAGELAYVSNGVTRLSADLETRFTYPYGDVVALDAQANAYVAGGFSAPTDFGTGTIAPQGNVDVFVVKLSPRGQVLFARALGLCGDAVQSIAVDAKGRIAISGDALGTVVLDAAGNAVLQLAPAGYVAFDSHGALVIGGMVAGSLAIDATHTLSTTGSGDADAFVAKFDVDGRLVFATQLGDEPLPLTIGGGTVVDSPRAQAIAGVAVGPDDAIAITGLFYEEMSLFGQRLEIQPSYDSGQFAGQFVAKLAPDGTPALAFFGDAANSGAAVGGLTIGVSGAVHRPGTAIAVDAAGDIVISDNTAGDLNPPEYPQLTKYDGATGDVLFGLDNNSGPAGQGEGVAVDGCGTIYWASFATEPSIFDSHTFLMKVAP